MRNLIKACLVSGLISVGLTAGVRAETLFIDTATAAVDTVPQGDSNMLYPVYVPTPPVRPATLSEDAARPRVRTASLRPELARTQVSATSSFLADRKVASPSSPVNKVWMTVGMGF